MRSHHKIILIVAGIVALLWGAFAVQLWLHYRSHMEAAKDDIATVAALFEEHARRTFDPASHLMDEIARRCAESGLRSDQVMEVLGLAAAAPGMDAVLILDADGRMVAHSEGMRPDVDFSDRAYFQAHRSGVDVFFGKVVRSRVSGRNLFTLSRRLVDADGAFVGAVTIGVHERHFNSFHERYGGPATRVALYDAQGGLVLATARADERHPAHSLHPPGDLQEIATLEGTSAQGEAVIASFRRVEGSPMIVGVFLPEAEVASRWLYETANSAMLGAAATVLLVVLMARLRAAVRRLDAAREAAVQANAAKSKFLTAVGHDLHQPLRAAELFLEHAAAVRDGDRDGLIADARAAIGMLDEMLTSLVQYALTERGQIDPRPELLPVDEVIAPVVATCREAASRRRLQLRWVPSSMIGAVDPVLLRRCVGNLMANALKHARGRILVGCRRDGGAVRIEVWDDGRGIAPEQFVAIFQEFHKEGPQDCRVSAGLGLGLAVVDQIASRLGWEVSVKSRPGKGSCFSITVPLADLSAMEDAAEEGLVPA